MRKAWKLLNVLHIFCVAHGIHNLFMKDCFPTISHVSEILDKVQVSGVSEQMALFLFSQYLVNTLINLKTLFF